MEKYQGREIETEEIKGQTDTDGESEGQTDRLRDRVPEHRAVYTGRQNDKQTERRLDNEIEEGEIDRETER
jgi:hypothetical protein